MYDIARNHLSHDSEETVPYHQTASLGTMKTISIYRAEFTHVDNMRFPTNLLVKAKTAEKAEQVARKAAKAGEIGDYIEAEWKVKLVSDVVYQ